MKIVSVNIPAEGSSYGLQAIEMSHLQNIVILAGKNGSGKSRILSAIREAVKIKPVKSAVERATEVLVKTRPSLKRELQYLETKSARLQDLNGEAKSRLAEEIQRHQANIASLGDRCKGPETTVDWKLVEFEHPSENYPIVQLVPKATQLSDSRRHNPEVLGRLASAVNIAGIENLADGTFAKIQTVQDLWFDATHPLSLTAANSKTLAIDNYARLQSMLRSFLNTELNRTPSGEATLFGFRLGDARMSEGQTIILQWCVAIFSQAHSLDDVVVFLDEPENHLHPCILLELISLLQKLLSKGQMWIATHSIPLLASFDPSYIWYVQDNRIGFAGKSPQKVLEDLIGGDERRSQLRDFMDLPNVYAMNRHAYECLFASQPVTTGADDPQTSQIRTHIRQITRPGFPLRILDFGAGKGRLVANIVESRLITPNPLEADISYFAFDPSSEHKQICIENIAKLHANAGAHYFNDFNELLTHQDAESFDVVVLCNVLHEIDPARWLDIFGPDGTIPRLLHADGFALVVEDQIMPVGEKAYQKGFVVLDTAELKILFNITQADTRFSPSDARGDGRLKAHLIPREALTRITAATRSRALMFAGKKAQQRIAEMRAAPSSYLNGRRHGFWVQQLANTQLCLTELGIATDQNP